MATETHWDAGAPFEYTYQLKIDPDQDNNGDIVFTTLGTQLTDNEWQDFVLPTDEQARDAEGNFIYTLTITAQGPLDPMFPFVTANSFKVRSSGIVAIDEIFSFVSEATSIVDLGIIYPNLDTSNGVSDEDKIGANYNGEFCFRFNVDEDNLVQIDFWDGDADRGNFDGTQTDTDDLNTPNVIPGFAPPGSDVVAEGVNIPAPFDDVEPITDFDFLILQPGSVSYSVSFPDGQLVTNNNPSGNTEWELYNISTLTNNPNIVDEMVDDIPTGEYELCFQGLDINNFVSLRPLQPVIFLGEEIIDEIPTVPTMSEWGLLAVAVIFGLIGIAVVRRKQIL